MKNKNIKAFQKTIQQSNEWIQDLMSGYDFGDENKAFVLLRATLKALRDRISQGEAFHLGSQLPALIRGFYFEGWNPNKSIAKVQTVEDFMNYVQNYLRGHEDIELEYAVPVALRIIFNRIDQDEANDVKHNLPLDIQELCH